MASSEELKPIDIWVPDYKDEGDRPEDRALIISDGEQGKCIAWIGPSIDAWMEDFSEESVFALKPGVWIAKVRMETTQDYGGDWDSDLIIEGERKPTPNEWEMIMEDHEDGPWRPADWLKNPISDLPKEGPSDLPEGWNERSDARSKKAALG